MSASPELLILTSHMTKGSSPKDHSSCQTHRPCWDTRQMPLQGMQWLTEAHLKRGMCISVSSTDLLNLKNHTPSCTEKPQVLIDLVRSIIQTHWPTWSDFQELFLMLFNTEDHQKVIQAALQCMLAGSLHPAANTYNKEWTTRRTWTGKESSAQSHGIRSPPKGDKGKRKWARDQKKPKPFYESLCEIVCLYIPFDTEVTENQWVVNVVW